MIDVGHKAITVRTAEASGSLVLLPTTLERIRTGELAKGDAINTARVAGIMAAKRTAEFVPLCHPLPLDAVDVDVHFEKGGDGRRAAVTVAVRVATSAKTGVEMEAIMGVNAALITIYDLSKIVNPHLKIDNVKLLIKEGGKSGLWTNPDGLPEFLKNIF